MRLLGWHHVTAITANAPANLRFYRDVLGLRLVKKSVNQDDVSAYHLFYADAVGTPGTDLTFFDWPQTPRHQPGVSDISRTTLRVPAGALPYWLERLQVLRVPHGPTEEVHGRPTVAFTDPEGQRLALVATDEPALPPEATPWTGAGVPADAAVRGLGPMELTVRKAGPTLRCLTELLGFTLVGEAEADGGRDVLLRLDGTGAAGEVHLRERPALPFVRHGFGGVHHVALRSGDAAAHRRWFDRLTEHGVRSSGLVDRYYFESLYFREPNGILFELATDGPGFAADEPPEHLGERLALPPFLEPHRAEIEAGLAPLPA